MKRKMSNEDLLNKIELEGSVLSTIEYGIEPEDIEDEEFASRWSELVAKGHEWIRLADTFEDDLFMSVFPPVDIDEY